MKAITGVLCALLLLSGCTDDLPIIQKKEITTEITLPVNGNFESGDSSWFMSNGNITTEESNTGSSSLYFNNESAQWAAAEQYIRVPADAEKFTLHGWIRAEDVVRGSQSWESALFSFEYLDNDFSHLNPYPQALGQVNGTSGWKEYSGTYNVIDGATVLKVYAALVNAPGEAWFDDISIEFYDSQGNVVEATEINDQYFELNYYTYSPDSHIDDIAVSSPEKFGADTAKLNALVEAMTKGEFNDVNSLLIMHRDSLVVEEYFNGWTKEEPHQVQSVSKSITSILAGIAVREGMIDAVTDPIQKYLPEFSHLFVDGKEEITVKNLLTMSAGLEWDEWSVSYEDAENPMNDLWNSDNSIEFVLSQPLVKEPGEEFVYSGGFVHVMAKVIENASGMALEDFAEKNLFKPMNMGDITWARQKDKKVASYGGVHLRPRDMIKVGQLMLNDGTYGSTEILTPEWVTESTDSVITIVQDTIEYGYYWWTERSPVDSREIPVYYAAGYGRQLIFIYEELDLIVVTTAENFNKEFPTSRMLREFILPAFL